MAVPEDWELLAVPCCIESLVCSAIVNVKTYSGRLHIHSYYHFSHTTLKWFLKAVKEAVVLEKPQNLAQLEGMYVIIKSVERPPCLCFIFESILYLEHLLYDRELQ